MNTRPSLPQSLPVLHSQSAAADLEAVQTAGSFGPGRRFGTAECAETCDAYLPAGRFDADAALQFRNGKSDRRDVQDV